MADIASTSSTTTSTTSTAKQEPELQSHMYRYKVVTFTIENTKDEDYKEYNYMIPLDPVSIKVIKLVQNFDIDIHPIFEITAVLPPPVVDYINTHMNDIKFILRIDMIDFVTPNNNMVAGSGRAYDTNGAEILCDDKFITFVPDNMKMSNLADYRTVSDVLAAKENSKNTIDLFAYGHNTANYTSEINLFLWNEHDLYTTRKQVNTVYSSISIGDAAASMLSENGFNHVLIAPATNGEKYGQLIIPPMTMMNVFRFLQNQYGMYDTDVIFFTDLWRTYVIDKSGECKAHEENEYTRTIFSVVPTNSEYSQDTGTSELLEKKEYHMRVDTRKVFVRSLSSVHDVIQGNTNMYIDARNNEVTTVSGAGEQRGEGCVNVTTDREGTEYTKSQQANAVSEMALNLKISDINAYNYFALSPNKSFIVSFRDKDFYVYNGYYRLMKAIHIFTREASGDQMSVTALDIEFTRKKLLSEEERKTIEYDVFRTAQVTEEGTEAAKSNGEDNKQNDPSYSQSQDNRVAEGKEAAPKAEPKKSPAPGSITDRTSNTTVIPATNRITGPSKSQPFNPDTNEKYQAQEAKRNDTIHKESITKGRGTKKPTPLDQK
jgi:hypothetical protein